MPAWTAAASTATGPGEASGPRLLLAQAKSSAAYLERCPRPSWLLPRAGLAVGSCEVPGVWCMPCPSRPRCHLLGLKAVGARLRFPEEQSWDSLRSIRNSVEVCALNYTFSNISLMQYILRLLFFFISIYNLYST